MKIKDITYSHRNDFKAVFMCESASMNLKHGGIQTIITITM